MLEMGYEYDDEKASEILEDEGFRETKVDLWMKKSGDKKLWVDMRDASELRTYAYNEEGEITSSTELNRVKRRLLSELDEEQEKLI